MGIGDLFKGMLGGSPGRIDYAELSDDDLLRLFASKVTLTDDARRALEGEMERRQLNTARAPKAEAPEPRAPGGPAEERPRPPAAPIQGDPVLVLERRGIVLRTQANASALVMMPIWDGVAPFSIARPEVKSNVTEIVVLNQSDLGFLPTAYVAERLTVRNEKIFVFDPDHLADRPQPELAVQRTIVGVPLPEQTTIGQLTLLRTEFPDVLIATWESNDMAIAIGPRIPPALFGAYEGITHVIGGLLPPQTEEEREIYSDPDLYLSLDTVILLLDHAGVSSWPVTLLPSLGVTVQAVGREEGSDTDELVIAMKRAVDEDAWDRAAELFEELSAREIEDVVDGLAIERNLGAARRVVELALASEDWRDSGQIHFLAGAVRFMSGDREGAIACYRRAVEGEEPEARAWANLSAIHRRAREHQQAIECAENALEAIPRDAIALGNLIAAFASAGRIGDAKSAVDRGEQVLGSAGAMEWRARIDAWPPFEEGPDEFPHLADKAYQIGCVYASSGRVSEAIGLLRRCLELMPSHLEAILELGVLLSSCDRDREAMELYDGVLAKAPGISFVRFNRANCLVRLERIDEAVAELERVAREVPEWDAPQEALKALASADSGSAT